MQKFNYEARTQEGAVYKGVLEGARKQDVVDELLQQGLTIVSVNQETGFSLKNLSQINIGGVPMKDRVIFMRQLATMISAGLPLSQALGILEQQAENPRFKAILGDVLADVNGGVALATAFAKYSDSFDEVTISLIEAGEASGNLENILVRVASEMEERKKLQEKVKSAFTYPAVISVVVLVVIAILVTVLVPAMKEIYDEFDADLPFVTQLLVDISDFVINYWWVILAAIGIAVVGIKSYLDTEAGKMSFHTVLLKVPVFGSLMTKIQITQFTRILSLLLRSGMSIIDALDLTARSLSNLHFRAALMNAKKEVSKGVPMAVPLSRSEYIPLIVSQMVAVGEESGEVDLVLEKMSEFYSSEVEVMTSNLTTLLEPLILAVMGVVIGFVAFAVYMPMFSLVEVIG